MENKKLFKNFNHVLVYSDKFTWFSFSVLHVLLLSKLNCWFILLFCLLLFFCLHFRSLQKWKTQEAVMKFKLNSIKNNWKYQLAFRTHQSWSIFVIMPRGNRGIVHTNTNSIFGDGKSYQDINKEIYWLCIAMASLIALLILLALLYIAYEKLQKHRELR